MKTQSVSVRKVKHPRYKYRVTYNQGGEYRQEFFKTKKAAELAASKKEAELENVGTAERGVTPQEYRAVLTARQEGQKLVAEGISEPLTLEAAIAHYAAHIRRTKSSVTVKKAKADFLDAKEREGISAAQTRNLTYRLKAFEKKHATRTVANFEQREIEGWIHGLKCAPRTRENYRLVLGNFFQHCVRRKWMDRNPAREIKISIKHTPPEILQPEQVGKLLAAAVPEIVPTLAISFFAGLRDAELQRLDWSEINLERGFIEVKAAKSKTAQRRLVTIEPNLKAWLEPHRKLAGAVRPTEQVLRDRRDAARLTAGLTEWPSNCGRHSFASYHLAKGSDSAKTALQLGHSDTKLLFQHYRELVTLEDAEKFFAIKPKTEGEPENVVEGEFKKAS